MKRGSRKGNKIIIDGKAAYVVMKNGIVIIDAEDAPRVAGHTWHINKQGYVQSNDYTQKPKQYISLARLILFGERHATDTRTADHKKHNLLDNRKKELRATTKQQNILNQLPRKGGASKFKGVSWEEQRGKWRARITVNNITIHLGLYGSEIETALAYDRSARKLHKEFSYVNFFQKGDDL